MLSTCQVNIVPYDNVKITCQVNVVSHVKSI